MRSAKNRLGQGSLGALALLCLVTGCGQAAPEGTYRSVTVTEDGRTRQLAPDTGIRLTIDGDTLTAYAGCNELTGQVRTDGDRLVVSDLVSSDRGCPAELARQDAWRADFLRDRPAFAQKGEELVLRGGATEIVIVRALGPGAAGPPADR
jgi:heat shock protein HslJ